MKKGEHGKADITSERTKEGGKTRIRNEQVPIGVTKRKKRGQDQGDYFATAFDADNKGPNQHQSHPSDGAQNLDESVIQAMKSMSHIYPNIH